MKFALVLTCLCFFSAPNVHGTSKRVLDFLSYINGDYDNKAQTETVGDNHAFLQLRFKPVDIKCLRSNAVYYLEEAAEKVVRVFGLAMVKDGMEDTVALTIYALTNYTKYKPRELNVEKLANIPCEDIQEIKDCTGSFRVAREGFVYGNFPSCGSTINGKHPRFSAMFTCSSMILTVAMYSNQTSPIEPYELPRTGQKYPLINPPADYVAPCGN